MRWSERHRWRGDGCRTPVEEPPVEPSPVAVPPPIDPPVAVDVSVEPAVLSSPPLILADFLLLTERSLIVGFFVVLVMVPSHDTELVGIEIPTGSPKDFL